MKHKAQHVLLAVPFVLVLAFLLTACGDSLTSSLPDGDEDGDYQEQLDGDDVIIPDPSDGDTTETQVDPDGDEDVSPIDTDGDEDEPDDEDGDVIDWGDYDGEYTDIALGCDDSTITGPGATKGGNDIIITASGIYHLSGTLCDGQIRINTEEVDPVVCIFDDISITSSTSAPFYVVKAEDVEIQLLDGTLNTLTDANSYVYPSSDVDEPNAALFSKEDLKFTGNGALTVNGNFNDGITSKDSLKIKGGTFVINAVDDGIRGKDKIKIDNGDFTIDAGGDGLTSDNEEDAEKGYIEIEGGVFQITAGGDGLAAETNVIISAGAFHITAGDGSNATLAEDASGKGIKGNGSVLIEDGSFTIDSADDGIHSNGSIVINGGTYTISVAQGQGGGGFPAPGGPGDPGTTGNGQDGMHSDTTLEINAGTITVAKSYEGLEAMTIIINGGDIMVTASDDGFNCAGGDGSSGWEPGAPTAGEYYLIINDGNIWMDAGGDGLDSNGSIEINGGVILVNGPTDDGNGPIDSGDSPSDTIEVNGGFLVAAGSAGMAESPDGSSTQNSVIVFLTSDQRGGQIFHIQKNDGSDLLTFAPTKTYRSVVFSSPDFINGQYSIYLGGSSSGTEANGLYTDGSYNPGSLYQSFSVTSITTQVGSGGMPH